MFIKINLLTIIWFIKINAYICSMTRIQILKQIKLKGLRQDFIASKLKVSQMQISHALSGKRKTKAYKELLMKIEKVVE